MGFRKDCLTIYEFRLAGSHFFDSPFDLLFPCLGNFGTQFFVQAIEKSMSEYRPSIDREAHRQLRYIVEVRHTDILVLSGFLQLRKHIIRCPPAAGEEAGDFAVGGDDGGDEGVVDLRFVGGVSLVFEAEEIRD